MLINKENKEKIAQSLLAKVKKSAHEAEQALLTIAVFCPELINYASAEIQTQLRYGRNEYRYMLHDILNRQFFIWQKIVFEKKLQRFTEALLLEEWPKVFEFIAEDGYHLLSALDRIIQYGLKYGVPFFQRFLRELKTAMENKSIDTAVFCETLKVFANFQRERGLECSEEISEQLAFFETIDERTWETFIDQTM
jgi:hypothetical protein